MNLTDFNQGLLGFLHQSPTPFHATKNLADSLRAAGYQRLEEGDTWKIESSGKYFVTRNDSSIIAFSLNGSNPVEHGFHMVGAHTDSPCLKVKPVPVINKKGYFQLGVEVYGGVLLNPWFDRDLSIAGRVSYKTNEGALDSLLINFERPVAVIPSLAIHLNREVNAGRAINSQKDILPIIGQMGEDIEHFGDWLKKVIQEKDASVDISEVLDYELFFYDVQKPALIGYYEDFIASARLDNLLSCYTGLTALLHGNSKQPQLLVCNDHEEVGSMSACGAQGPFLKSVIERLVGTGEDFARCIHNSCMVSADNAHGVHPNFTEVHDENHDPILNQGPVVKINANQRYATNSETSAMFRAICKEENIPVQTFVMRSDMACGSTIGPITATELGVKTIDIGVPTFAMHSIRELAGQKDAHMLYRVLKRFFQRL